MKIFLYLAFLFSSMKLICKATPTDRSLVFENEVKAPNISKGDLSCGTPNPLAFFYGVLEGRKVPAYHLNTTAENLVSDGFEITVNHLTDDAIFDFSASNGTFNVSYSFEGFGGLAAVGGQPASRTRAFYMAQLGFRNGDIIEWLCDGVLINRDWILSAAHCFLETQYVPNLVRLGDYDLNEPEEKNENHFGKFTYDYEMEETIFHPEFQLEERYHDLVLIRIPRNYPKLSASINPICLPWDSLTNQNLVGNHVTLTGWGATHYGGSKTALLQEVVLEVYPTSKCQENYAKVPNFKQRYPKGIDEDAIICVGWKTDGKDACGGDSGAPIVYEPSNSSIVLVGIVSGGFGCGQKEFPGLYIPINKPKYLQWIRDVAF